MPPAIEADWHAIRPGTDVAMMLGIAHTLMSEDLHDRAFLDRYCVGYPTFEDYLPGDPTASRRTPDWAAAICGVPAETIRALARQVAGRRTLITCAQSLQRAEHGEQPVWMGVVLAAMLGQIGLPGGGFVVCYGVDGAMSASRLSRCRCRPCRRAQPGPGPDPGGADRRHAAAPGRRRTTSTGAPDAIPTSGWSTGPAATRSTTTRTSTGCARRSPVPTR